ncbi:MAG: NAD(P)H-hydrate dehydratase [Bacillota bacterium]
MYLVSGSEMREIDAKAQDMGLSAMILMENAGRALAAEAAAFLGPLLPGGAADRTREIPKALVFVGPGQNGGDGFCAARHLSSMGYPVKVLFFGEPSRLPPEARANYDALVSYPVEILEWLDTTAGLAAEGHEVHEEHEEHAEREEHAGGGAWWPDWADGPVGVAIDALLGTGQKGDPKPPIDAAVRIVNSLHRRGIPVVACDVPTGVDANTGRLYEPAVLADATVTMGLPKIGLYSYPGRANAGRIVTDSLGLPPALTEAPSAVRAVFIEDARQVMPSRGSDHHKGMSGHVTVVAGSVGMAGAAALCAKATLRAGAGTVTLLCPEGIYEACAPMVPEVMVLPCIPGSHLRFDGAALEVVAGFLPRSSCLVIGPGIGRDGGQERFLEGLLPLVVQSGVPCLIDADGLYALSRLGGLSYLARYEGKFILTPHPGELAVLTGAATREIGLDRPGHALRAAMGSKSVVCLKGAGTCVANSSGDLRVNTSGDPAMATAGSGDVLAGVVAALVSQGLSTFDASWLGVFWHGLAGELARRKFGSYGAIAGDLCDSLPEARHAIEGR